MKNKANQVGILILVGMLLFPIVIALAIFVDSPIAEAAPLIYFLIIGFVTLLAVIFYRRLLDMVHSANKYNWFQKWNRIMLAFVTLNLFLMIAEMITDVPTRAPYVQSMGYGLLVLLLPVMYFMEKRKLEQPMLRHEGLAMTGVTLIGLNMVTGTLARKYDVEGLPGYALCLGPLIIGVGMLIVSLVLYLNWRERQKGQSAQTVEGG